MLEALDLLDRVVGIGEFGPWPEELGELPVAGGYSSPNVETVLELEADLLLTADSQAAAHAHRKLEQLGVRVLALDTRTYEGVFSSLLAVGEMFDVADQALAAEDRIRGELARIRTRAEPLERRRVLFVVGQDPLFVAGPGSHIDEMIRIAGGANVAADAISPYQQVSLEAILERMPDVIIDASDNRATALRGREAGAWGRWPFLPAVEQKRVYWVDPSRLVIPGVRIPEMSRRMGRLIHPEQFGEPQPADFFAEGTDDARW
jgi:iron complex transport system substrate-binding protein